MPSLRQDLEAACANLRRQMEVQRSSMVQYASLNDPERRDALVAELQAELTQLEDALANLGADSD